MDQAKGDEKKKKYLQLFTLLLPYFFFQGAGSCLETLGAGKAMVVVINELLMGNHQLELANQLHRDGHLFYCTPR